MEPEVVCLIQRAEALISEINAIGHSLNKSEDVFRSITVQPLQFSCAEAGFLRVVSWLYILYYESGRINVDFLLSHLEEYSLDSQKECLAHYKLIHAARTTTQHSLDSGEIRDMNLKRLTEQWLSDHCEGSEPTTSEQWHECLLSVLGEAEHFLDTLLDCLHQISTDEFCEQLIHEWDYRCSRYHPPHEFDRIISIAASDLGQDFIDPVLVRKKFYSQWAKEMELLQDGFDFEIEARKRIEMVLLTSPVLPITGTDIMQEFNLAPGPKVGVLWREANRLYSECPCGPNELMERLRESIGVDS